MVCLHDRGVDGLLVQRAKRPQIHNLAADSFLCENVRCIHCSANSSRERNKRHMRPFALNLGLANGGHILGREHFVAHIEDRVVHQLALKENSRIRVTNSSLQQRLCVLTAPRSQHLQARHLRVPGSKALRMLCSNTCRCTVRASEHNRRWVLSGRHVQVLGCRVDDVVDGLHREVECHELADWSEAGNRSTDSNASQPSLGDGCVDHAFRAKLLEQTATHLVGTVELTNFLANKKDTRVTRHLLLHGLGQGVAHCHLSGESASVLPRGSEGARDGNGESKHARVFPAARTEKRMGAGWRVLAVLLLCTASSLCATATAPTSVLVVTLGRSGSTLTTELLATLPGVFSVFEPYYNFRDRTAPAASRVSPPTFTDLFDCNIFNSTAVANAVVSPYFCDYFRLIKSTASANSSAAISHSGLHWRCRNQKMNALDVKYLQTSCQRSHVILVKTIRFDRFHSLLNSTALASNLHVVYLTRHPFEIFKSRYVSEWSQAPSDFQRNHTKELLFLAAADCNQMIITHNALISSQLSVVPLTYEALLRDKLTSRKILTRLIKLPWSESVNRLMDAMSVHNFEVVVKSPRRIDFLHNNLTFWEKQFESLPICARAISMYQTLSLETAAVYREFGASQRLHAVKLTPC
eukprot:m.363348 g.363348  ORF g.363348 m.363348 type:complete len:638 (-) comp56025_c0_seq3:2412-4325(-)